MAEEKKSGSARMYGKTPKIEPEGKGDTVKSEGGAPDKANAEAKSTAGDPPSHVTEKDEGRSGTEAKGDVMAGTDGIDTHHVQSGERDAIHHRQMMDHVQRHERHQRERLMHAMGHGKEATADMHKRHFDEKRSMHTRHEAETRDMNERHGAGPSGGIEEKEVSKSGTNKD